MNSDDKKVAIECAAILVQKNDDLSRELVQRWRGMCAMHRGNPSALLTTLDSVPPVPTFALAHRGPETWNAMQYAMREVMSRAGICTVDPKFRGWKLPTDPRRGAITQWVISADMYALTRAVELLGTFARMVEEQL